MIKRIIRFCKLTFLSSPLYFSFNIVAMLGFSLIQLGIQYSFKLASDTIISVQNSGTVHYSFALPILLFFVFIIIGGNTNNVNSMIITIYTNKAKKIFTKAFMYASYQKKQDQFYDNEFLNDYHFVRNSVGKTTELSVTIFNHLIYMLFTLMISVYFISSFNIILLVFIVISSLLMVFLNCYIVRKRMSLEEKFVQDERKKDYYTELLSSREHAKELRIFHLKSRLLKMWQDTFMKFSKEKCRFENKAMILSELIGIGQEIFSAMITIYLLYLVSIHSLSVGDFVFLISIMWSLTGSILGILNILTKELASNYKYVKKYDAFVGNVDQDKLDRFDASSDLCQPEFKDLVLHNVSYSYPNQKSKAIVSASIRIQKGEVVSILGDNGSGKSTLSKIICGILQDYDGDLRLNGQNYRTISHENLSRFFGVAFQDFARYSLSIKENIGFGDIEKIEDDTAIGQAVKAGNLTELVGEFPLGINTIIGKEYDSGGEELSGGQWQRIALARAYMGEPEFLILDEPTASVDPLEEIKMLSHFREIIKNRTALLISHRIGFAKLADRIYIMDKGEIVESGTHDELLSQKGKYYEMFMAQKGLYEDGNDSE